MKHSVAVLTLAMAAGPLLGQQEEQVDAPLPPPLPPKVQPPSDGVEETVTIEQEAGRKVETYRRNGQIIGVKVIPDNAPPYYLYDQNGDGFIDYRSEIEPGVGPVYWRLFEW